MPDFWWQKRCFLLEIKFSQISIDLKFYLLVNTFDLKKKNEKKTNWAYIYDNIIVKSITIVYDNESHLYSSVIRFVYLLFFTCFHYSIHLTRENLRIDTDQSSIVITLFLPINDGSRRQWTTKVKMKTLFHFPA